MKLPGWVRNLCPSNVGIAYGNYGGARKRCEHRKKGTCPMPIDGMDALFQKHDYDLGIAQVFIDNGQESQGKFLKKKADEDLGRALRAYKGPYKRSVWGPVYRRLAMIPFR